ncbi:MAG: sugar ABC transporter substrate-binding protein [Treponema sp.]|nr:sugar ABC transporter substrate-binding protein [Treponema sp.]
MLINKITRKLSILFLGIALIFMFSASCQKNNTSENNTDTEHKEIRVLLADHPYGNLLYSLIPDFEKETGIKVLLEHYNENELTNRLNSEFSEGIPLIDVFMTRPMTETLLFLKNNWMMPLDGYDLSDYPSNTLEIGVKDGKPYFIPLVVEWQVLYYRKDLLEAAGLRVPVNFNELENAARVLNRDGVAGFASRGAPFPAVSQISSFIFSYGGRYINNGAAVFDTPEAVDAFRYYGRILGMYGPQGIAGMSWDHIMPIFQAGRLAMWTDASVFYGQLIDPQVSNVPAENVGVARLPRGPVSQQPYIVTSWGMSISSSTKDFDSSMRFLEWAASKEIAQKAMLANIPMARLSVWNDPSVTTHINPGIVDTMIHASQFGNPYPMPLMTSIVQARNLIGEVISESINTRGTSPRLQSLAAQKNAELNQLLRNDGEYGTAR